MCNKIDKRIFEKIYSLKNDTKINVVVSAYDYISLKKILEKKEIIEIPFLYSIATNLTINEIYKLANLQDVKYISSDIKVSSLIYNSKKFIGLDSINKTMTANHCVVIIDTGIYPHIDFCLGRNRIVKFVDLVNGKSEMYDDNGHGTFVSGILCGNSITNKYSGIDNICDIIVIKALDSDGETDSITILRAMQWVVDNKEKFNIKVACMSFGSVLGDENDPLVQGVGILWDNGITVVCAGGNSGPESSTIMSPGANKKIITVGSLDDITTGQISVADFSSRGPVFDYYKPDMVVPGVNIISTGIFNKKNGFYTKMSGTSVSTPMVVGIISLLYRMNPNYTPEQIKYLLIKSCVKITGNKNEEGFGWLNVRNLIL